MSATEHLDEASSVGIFLIILDRECLFFHTGYMLANWRSEFSMFTKSSLKPSSTLSRSIAVAFEYIWTYIVKPSERSLQESFARSILARPLGEAAEFLHRGPCRVLRSQNGCGSHVLRADSACPPQPCCWAFLSLLSRSTGNTFICMDKKKPLCFH